MVEILRIVLADGEIQRQGWASVWRRADGGPGRSNAFGAAVLACGGADAVVSALRQWQVGPASVLEQALHATWILSRGTEPPRTVAAAGGIEAVVAVMRAHGGSVPVQQQGCIVLKNLAGGCCAEENGMAVAVVAAGGIAAVVAAMRAHGMSVALLEKHRGAVQYV